MAGQDRPAPPGSVVPAFCDAYPPPPAAGQWQSSRVLYSGGKLMYPADEEHNRIPDYSYAGYHYGQTPLPDVPTVATLSPMPGDNTARIQAAIDMVGQRPLDAKGFRGALLLAPGTYEIAGALRVNKDGVVLRGSGSGNDPARDTIFVATGDTPHQRTVVTLGSGSPAWTESAQRTNIATPFVQVGAMSFDVESATGFAVGDNVSIRHPSTQAWIDAVGGGGVINSTPWKAGNLDIVYNRRITKLTGNTVEIDAPIYNHLDKKLSQAFMAKTTPNYIREAGVEKLRIDVTTAAPDDENHAWIAVRVSGAYDSWVTDVTALHFGYAGVNVTGGVRITVDRCKAFDPVAIRTGGRMYNFSMERYAQLVLFENGEASNGRHCMIDNGVSTSSGIVFHRMKLTNGGGNEAGHRMWTQGVLFDSIVETQSTATQALLMNRGDAGTSHGWGTVHSTIWDFNQEIVVQKPPTGQNYAVSSAGRKRAKAYNPGPDGFIELKGPGLTPKSLYEAQLCERLRRP